MSLITSGTDYDAIKLAHNAAVTEGEDILANGRVLVALSAAAINTLNIFAIEGLLEAPKVAATAIAAGATLYWDNAAGNYTTVAVGNTKAGYATEAALAADTVVQMKLTNDANL